MEVRKQPILQGGFSEVESINLKDYSLQGTPKYDVSWGYYEKAAKGKNPWGLVMAASYLIWPDCTNSSVVIDPDRGFNT